MNKLRLEISFLTGESEVMEKPYKEISTGKEPTLFQNGLGEDHGRQHMAGVRN